MTLYRDRGTAKRPKRPGAKFIDVYSLKVRLTGGPLTEAFQKANPLVERTIEMRGDQTLHELHKAIFRAFEREEERLYQFDFEATAHDPVAKVFVRQKTDGVQNERIAADQTLMFLRLKVADTFQYLFDFEANWKHAIDVLAIEREATGARYPRIKDEVGASPLQLPAQDFVIRL